MGRVVVTVVVVAALLTGCGGGDEGDDVAAEEAGAPPTGLPIAFAGGENGWGRLLATSDLLVGYGTRGEDDPADLGEVVDLATGETWGLGRPETDPPFSPDTAVALDDELVVSGQICPPGSRSSDAADPCTNLATYRVDPVTATWTAVAPPATADLAERMYATPDGAVAVFRTPDGPDHAVLARLGSDGWEVLGPVPRANPTCATATELFSMVQGPGPPAPLIPGDPPEGTSTWTITTTSFADGSSRPVAVPDDLPRFFGSAPFELVCGREAPVIGMTDPETRRASVVRLVDGERWEEVAGIVPETGQQQARGFASGEVAVVTTDDVAGDPTSRAALRGTAVRADGTTEPLVADLDLRGTELVPRGVDGPFVAVGPVHEEAEPGVDEPPVRDPVPVRLLPALA